MKSALVLWCHFFRREWLIQSRQLRFLINSCLFFLMIVFLFPLTLTPDPLLMHSIAPGLVWVALLLALLLSSERLFYHDDEYGVLEQWLVSGQPLSVIIAAKTMAHWLLTLIPIVLLCPLLALVFSLSHWELSVLIISLILGTPALVFLCALAAAFSVVNQQKGALMALILLPLTLPILIFGSGTANLAVAGLPISANCALLASFSLLAAGFLPSAIDAVLRIQVEG